MSFLKLNIFQWPLRHFVKSEIFQTLHNPTKREEFKISYQTPKGTLLSCQGHWVISQLKLLLISHLPIQP